MLFSLSKCQKKLKERNQMSKISPCIRSLLNFWKESSHKEDPVSQNMISSLMSSIQDTTSKEGMARGVVGIPVELRTGLLQCLPVLENHLEYFRAMAGRKQSQRMSDSDITTAAECVIRDISEREKIIIVEIGEKEVTSEEVKNIVDTLSEKDFYEPINLTALRLLPDDRKRRFRILNQFLHQQSPLKLCLWMFDNPGVSPQSVFGILISLEDSPNDVLKHVMELRPQLLADQKM